MSAPAPARPEANEYASYYEKYVSKVPDADLIETLERQSAETLALLRALPEKRGAHRYEPGKWSVKQVVGHISDGERLFSYRALSIARGERAPRHRERQRSHGARARLHHRRPRSAPRRRAQGALPLSAQSPPEQRRCRKLSRV